MRRLIALATRNNIGLIVLGVLIGVLAVSIFSNDCMCAETGECFCVGGAPQQLHDVTTAEVTALPEPKRSHYQKFLSAWEDEYQSRLYRLPQPTPLSR